MMIRSTIVIAAALSLVAGSLPAFAKSPRVIDDNDTVSLKGNVHGKARPEFEVGSADPELPMERMVLTLRIPAARKGELERLLQEQQDPASPNYRRWLSPEQFAQRFAPDAEDVASVTGWLKSRGFKVEKVSRGRTSINFSGSAAQVERSFRTPIRRYQVDGRLHHANSRDPEIPRALADLVAGIVSLHDFRRAPMNSGARALAQGVEPNYTYGSSHYLAPADFAVIYNVKPLYDAGIDGTGQSVAIVGRTNSPLSSGPTGNWASFRSTMALPAKAPEVIIVDGIDPGSQGDNENNEADLIVEWAGAVAKNATIKFVTAKSTYATDGVDLSAQHIVDNDLAPVMSTSFGLCEAAMNAGENAFYNTLWQQAAALGITSFVSSGDSGAAGCSSAGAATGSGLGVNGLSSTPYNVSVGGTQFDDGGGGYWNAQNGAGLSSARGYIPEIAWNESGNVSGGAGLWSTGGGVSLIYAKPSWQAAPGVPAGSMRSIPDVSLTAAGHVGYLVRTQVAGSTGYYAMSGTSASSPAFAGLMALVVQQTGERQGNANVRLYQMGNAQYGLGGAQVFHDTLAGNNSVPGVTGYSCGTGYDLATGLGSVDANALVSNWAIPQLELTSSTLPNGSVGAAYSASVTATGGVPPYGWSVSAGALPPGLTLVPSSGALSGTPGAAGVYSFTLQVTDAVGAGAARTFSQAISATVCASQPVRIAGAVTYPDFPSAYLAAGEGAGIELQALDFSADFLLDRELSLSLTGGSDCGFGASPSASGILGKLQVSGGTVKLGKLRFK